jgi:hypothetical protein
VLVQQCDVGHITETNPHRVGPRIPRVDQRSPLAGGPSPSWPRVIADTIRLSRERRRLHRLEQGGGRHTSRLWIPIVCGLVVVLGGGLLIRAAFGSADPVPEVAPSPSPPPTTPLRIADPTALPSRSIAESSRATPSKTASVARAAAGVEIARRTDIAVSPAAAAVLREGKVDGRVLIVLASLASADLLTTIQVSSGGPAPATNLEMGVVDVDRVLEWLDGQRRLRPDGVEVRREASVAYLLLIHNTPEPPGLFPS